MIKRVLAALAVGLATTAVAAADDAVTPDEVVAKVREAAAYLSKEGAAGLPAFEQDGSPFVWKGTYVFVFDCAKDVIMAHPVAASRGVSISGLEGADGKRYGAALCDAAGKPGGGWGEYVWPKPVGSDDGTVVYSDDAFRKVTYMFTVEGQPYQVGAGIYNDAMTLADLDALVAPEE
jgi:hypothetical protein